MEPKLHIFNKWQIHPLFQQKNSQWNHSIPQFQFVYSVKILYAVIFLKDHHKPIILSVADGILQVFISSQWLSLFTPLFLSKQFLQHKQKKTLLLIYAVTAFLEVKKEKDH